MARAYIVEGSTGEHADHSDWPVAVFSTRHRATRFAKGANDWLKTHGLHCDLGYIAGYNERKNAAPTCPFDSNLAVDYTGSQYTVTPCRLDPEFPR
jgi:hypothetical protein